MEWITDVTPTWLKEKGRSERGASLVEYGLLLALIAIVALIAVQAFGQGVSTQFTNIKTSVTAS